MPVKLCLRCNIKTEIFIKLKYKQQQQNIYEMEGQLKHVMIEI